jgi:hypothetical protein
MIATIVVASVAGGIALIAGIVSICTCHRTYKIMNAKTEDTTSVNIINETTKEDFYPPSNSSSTNTVNHNNSTPNHEVFIEIDEDTPLKKITSNDSNNSFNPNIKSRTIVKQQINITDIDKSNFQSSEQDIETGKENKVANNLSLAPGKILSGLLPSAEGGSNILSSLPALLGSKSTKSASTPQSRVASEEEEEEEENPNNAPSINTRPNKAHSNAGKHHPKIEEIYDEEQSEADGKKQHTLTEKKNNSNNHFEDDNYENLHSTFPTNASKHKHGGITLNNKNLIKFSPQNKTNSLPVSSTQKDDDLDDDVREEEEHNSADSGFNTNGNKLHTKGHTHKPNFCEKLGVKNTVTELKNMAIKKASDLMQDISNNLDNTKSNGEHAFNLPKLTPNKKTTSLPLNSQKANDFEDTNEDNIEHAFNNQVIQLGGDSTSEEN